MTVTQTGLTPEEFLQRARQQLESPNLITQLGTYFATVLSDEVGDLTETGLMKAGLTVVFEPVRTGSGWEIGVGDKAIFGDRSDAAPTGTLRAFFDYLERVSGKKPRISNWWGMSEIYKRALALGRRGGMFGGIPGKAPYMWVQNYGSPRAGLKGKLFLKAAEDRFKANAYRIAEEWIRNA